MTPDQNKARVRRFFEEVWNQRKLDVIDEIFAPKLLLNGRAVERGAIKQLVAARLAAFPDIQVTVEDQVAEGDKVSTRRTWRGTNRGEVRGFAASNKQATWSQISIVRLTDEGVVEDWAVADDLAMLQQLGHLATP